MTSESTPEPDTPPEPPEEPVFPLLSAEQYKARVLRYLYILMRLLFVALFLGALYWLAGALGHLLVPLVVSLLLAYLLDPFIRRMEQRGFSRRIAILLTLGGVGALGGLVGVFLVPTLIEQLGALISRVPDLLERIQGEWIPWLEQRFDGVLPASEVAALEPSEQSGGMDIAGLARRVGAWTIGAASQTTQLLIGLGHLLLIPLFSYYFLRKIGPARRGLADVLPVRRREYTLKLLRRMHRAVADWFLGQVQVAAMVGVLFSVGLPISFGLAGLDWKLGIAIGILSGLLNIIPYFGMITAVVLTALVVLLDWPGWSGIFGIGIVFLINHVLESYVVGPKILGESVDLNPIAVIILALVGGELAGIVGILLFVPMSGALHVIWPDLMAIYRETAFYRGDLPEGDEPAD